MDRNNGFEMIESMPPEELYAFGQALADAAMVRPDLAHQLLLGFYKQMWDNGFMPSMGELFHSLQRHHSKMHATPPPIPFGSLQDKPSGVGKA